MVISGKVMEAYMGLEGIEAEHVTLAIENPHTEVQLLRYRNLSAPSGAAARSSRSTLASRRSTAALARGCVTS